MHTLGAHHWSYPAASVHENLQLELCQDCQQVSHVWWYGTRWIGGRAIAKEPLSYGYQATNYPQTQTPPPNGGLGLRLAITNPHLSPVHLVVMVSSRFESTIVGQFFGHTHMDWFIVFTDEDRKRATKWVRGEHSISIVLSTFVKSCDLLIVFWALHWSQWAWHVLHWF